VGSQGVPNGYRILYLSFSSLNTNSMPCCDIFPSQTNTHTLGSLSISSWCLYLECSSLLTPCLQSLLFIYIYNVAQMLRIIMVFIFLSCTPKLVSISLMHIFCTYHQSGLISALYSASWLNMLCALLFLFIYCFHPSGLRCQISSCVFHVGISPLLTRWIGLT